MSNYSPSLDGLPTKTSVVNHTPESWKIDPFKITNFERNLEDLQIFFCFCPAVAGKKATMISGMLYHFFADCGHPGTPFERITAMLEENSLDTHLRRSHIGKYNLLQKCYTTAVLDPSLELRYVTPEHLEKYCGYGMKSSRFLILHSQRNAKVAVIDTHILKYLREMNVDKVPNTIPTGKDYLRLEGILLTEADRLGLTMSDFDLQIWSWYASGNSGKPKFRPTQKLPIFDLTQELAILPSL
jgi:thermostable 8-oxoguanine DNA glycosylase